MTVRATVLDEFKNLYDDKYRYLVYWSGRSTGKSYAVAESQIIRSLSRPMKFLDCREIQGSIKDSVKALLTSIIRAKGLGDYFIIQRDAILGINGSEWVFKGLHNDTEAVKSFADFDEAWCEEAQSISYESIRALLPTMRKPGSRVIFTGNRLLDEDPYINYFTDRQELANKTLIKYLDPLTLDRYGLQPESMRELREAEKGNADYAFIWLGQPLSQVDNAILDRGKLVQSFERAGDDTGAWEFGVDVARFGGDRTVFVARKGLSVKGMKVYQHKPLTEQVQLLTAFIEELDAPKDSRIKIDETGIGGGWVDIATEQGLNAVAVNFAQKAKDADKYPNAANEMWFDMVANLPGLGLANVAQFRNDLLPELSQRSWSMNNRGQRIIESKNEFKAQGNRSPDLADALLLCFYEPRPVYRIDWG